KCAFGNTCDLGYFRKTQWLPQLIQCVFDGTDQLWGASARQPEVIWGGGEFCADRGQAQKKAIGMFIRCITIFSPAHSVQKHLAGKRRDCKDLAREGWRRDCVPGKQDRTSGDRRMDTHTKGHTRADPGG